MTWDESEVLLGTSWELGEHVVNNKNLKKSKNSQLSTKEKTR
jgi:hypothetical protein